MEYNSDFDVRLATLGALGGDTAKTYDSVYDIDLAILDAIEQGGGGGGMSYDQIKQLLATSGVTEIVVNGDGDSITIDYDLLSQIGQGGMDYAGMKDALSASTSGVTSIFVHDSGNTTGITMDYELLSQIGQGGGGMDYNAIQEALAETGVTGIKFTQSGCSDQTLNRGDVALLNSNGGQYICPPLGRISNISGNVTDGAIIYSGQYVDDQHKMVVITDYQDSNDQWMDFNIRVDYGNGEVYYVKQTQGGNNLRLRDGNESGDGCSFDGFTTSRPNTSAELDSLTPNKLGMLPLKFHFANGATGTLISASAITRDDPWEIREVYYFDQYDGAFPTITFETSSERKTIVETGATEERVSVNVPAKGWYKYYFGHGSLENGALEYDIFYDALNNSEFQTMMQHYDQYRMPLSIRFHFANEDSQYGALDLKCHAGELYFNGDTENPNKEVRFESDIISNANGSRRYFECYINYDNTKGWYYRGGEFISVITPDDLSRVSESVKKSIMGAESMSANFGESTLYNVALSGSDVMEIHRLQVNANQYDVTDWTPICNLRDNDRGTEAQLEYKYGKVRVKNLEFDATLNPSWQVIDYRFYWGEYNKEQQFVAMKIVDDGNDRYSVYCAVPAVTGGDRWGQTPYEFNGYGDDVPWRVWTTETDETITVTPHLYTVIPFTLNDWGYPISHLVQIV